MFSHDSYRYLSRPSARYATPSFKEPVYKFYQLRPLKETFVFQADSSCDPLYYENYSVACKLCHKENEDRKGFGFITTFEKVHKCKRNLQKHLKNKHSIFVNNDGSSVDLKSKKRSTPKETLERFELNVGKVLEHPSYGGIGDFKGFNSADDRNIFDYPVDSELVLDLLRQ